MVDLSGFLAPFYLQALVGWHAIGCQVMPARLRVDAGTLVAIEIRTGHRTRRFEDRQGDRRWGWGKWRMGVPMVFSGLICLIA